MVVIKVEDNEGKPLTLEFGNVPYLQMLNVANNLLNTSSNNIIIASEWNRQIAELAIMSPKKYSTNPQTLWDLPIASIGIINKTISQNISLKDFIEVMIGTDMEKLTEKHT